MWENDVGDDERGCGKKTDHVVARLILVSKIIAQTALFCLSFGSKL